MKLLLFLNNELSYTIEVLGT